VSVAACARPGGLELTGRLLAAADLPAGSAVLDVGCGAGASVAHLADEHLLSATGVDASAATVAQAGEARPDLDFVAGRAERLPFPAASFDAVLYECVLSTLPDPGAALAEAARVLRPGGALLVSDLYARSGEEADRRGGVPSLGSRTAVERLFAACRLSVTLWEDASEALGRYIWEHAAADGALGEERRASRSAERRSRPPAERRVRPFAERRTPRPDARVLGYFFCVARPRPSTRGAAGA
jgi:SAM-dependent methyltransferase